MFWEYTPMDGICQTTCKILTIVPCARMSCLISLGIFLARHIRNHKSIIRCFGNIHLWMEFAKLLTKFIWSVCLAVLSHKSRFYLDKAHKSYKSIVRSFVNTPIKYHKSITRCFGNTQLWMEFAKLLTKFLQSFLVLGFLISQV